MHTIMKNRLILGMLLSTFLLIALQPSSQALLMRSNMLSGTPPTIDGLMLAGEWTEAYTNVIPCYRVGDPATILYLTLKAMNDGQNIYLLAQWTDSTHTIDPDNITIGFDEDNDNSFVTPTQSENVVVVQMVYSGNTYCDYTDGYGVDHGFMVAPYNLDQNGTHGEADASWTPSQYTVEIRVPLNSLDQEDLQSKAGDLIGLSIIIIDGDYPNFYEFPYNIFISNNWYSNPFQLAAPSSIGTPTLFLVLLTIGMLALFITWKKYTPYQNLGSRMD